MKWREHEEMPDVTPADAYEEPKGRYNDQKIWVMTMDAGNGPEEFVSLEDHDAEIARLTALIPPTLRVLLPEQEQAMEAFRQRLNDMAAARAARRDMNAPANPEG